MAVEAAGSSPRPMSFGMSFDVIETLPSAPRGADRLRELRQHVHDLHSLTVPFADIHEANTARIQAENRLKRLLDHQHNLRDNDPSVVEQRRLLNKLTDDFKRLNERNETRSQAWREAGYTLQAVEGWLRDGRPPGTVLQDHEVPVPPLAKGENGLLHAIENRRRRVRELRADLHRIQSAPFPSSYAKQRMRQQVEGLATLGAPSVSSLTEHDRDIMWPTQRVTSSIYNAQPRAIGFSELPDALALVVWLHKDALIKQLDREIDSESDDAAALTHEARQQQEAEVQGDLLAVERDESALVWQAMAERLPVAHRSDCSPLAILQCSLITAPRANPSPGTSPMHAFDIVGLWR